MEWIVLIQEIWIKRSKQAREHNAPTVAIAPQGVTRIKLEDFAGRGTAIDSNLVDYANQGAQPLNYLWKFSLSRFRKERLNLQLVYINFDRYQEGKEMRALRGETVFEVSFFSCPLLAVQALANYVFILSWILVLNNKTHYPKQGLIPPPLKNK